MTLRMSAVIAVRSSSKPQPLFYSMSTAKNLNKRLLLPFGHRNHKRWGEMRTPPKAMTLPNYKAFFWEKVVRRSRDGLH